IGIYNIKKAQVKSEPFLCGLCFLVIRVREQRQAHSAILSAIALPYAGKSFGLRLEIRLPSTTTSSFVHSAPAFVMSSLIPGVLVTFLPFKISAETSTQPA